MSSNEEEIFKMLSNAVVKYNEDDVRKISNDILNKGIDPLKAINDGLVKGMGVIGNLFNEEKIYLPELILAGEACIVGIEILKSKMLEKVPDYKPEGKIVLGTVQGDIHDIGKRIVGVILQASGFEVYDIGKDQPADIFVEKAVEVAADIIGSSALMTVTREQHKVIEESLRKKGVRDAVKLLIGGAVVNEEYRQTIGADAYGRDALDAIKKAKEIISQKVRET